MSAAELWLSLDDLPGSTESETVSLTLCSNLASGDRPRFVARLTGRILDHEANRDQQIDARLTLDDLRWLHESTSILLRLLPDPRRPAPAAAREAGARE